MRLGEMRPSGISRLRPDDKPLKAALLFSLPFLAVICVFYAVFLICQFASYDETVRRELLENARAYAGLIKITRLWNANHGGVYVPETERTRPNPYLKIPERDIVTDSGKRLTMINPAYMTRQISELARAEGALSFRLTSLKPVNPVNSPDEWERSLLNSFEEGREEGFAFEESDKGRSFRYIAPLRVEAPCLRCHEARGYKIGDMRGGISVSFPAAGLEKSNMFLMRRSILSVGIAALFTAAFVIGVSRYFSKRLIDELKAEIESQKLRAAIELAGAAAHELRQPMTVILGLSELLHAGERSPEEVSRDLALIAEHCRKMDGIIKKMLAITEYKVKNYGSGTSILDLDASSEDGGKRGRSS